MQIVDLGTAFAQNCARCTAWSDEAKQKRGQEPAPRDSNRKKSA